MSDTQHNPELTSYRLKTIEETLASIGENLRQLTSLEQKHVETRQALERAFNELDKQDERIRKLELEMPTLQLIRNWVIAGVLSCIGMLGLAVFKVVAS